MRFLNSREATNRELGALSALNRGGRTVVGFDMEWSPNLRGGSEPTTDLVQIASRDSDGQIFVYLVHLANVMRTDPVRAH